MVNTTSHALTCSIYALDGAEGTSQIPSPDSCAKYPIIQMYVQHFELGSVGKTFTMYSDLMHVLFPVFCSHGVA